MNGVPGQVAVIGAGPGGLAAALSLKAFGLDPVVIDERAADAFGAGSRALFVHRESMSLLESVTRNTGVEISNAGIMWTARATWYAGREVFRRDDFGSAKAQGRIAPYASLPQSRTVEILQRGCERAGIPMVFGSKVRSVRTEGHRLSVETDDGVLSPQYVVGADGSRSVVRSSIDAVLEGPRLDGYHVVVDVRPKEGPLPTVRIMHYNCPGLDGRNALIIPFAGGYQIDVQARSEADAAQLEAVSRWFSEVSSWGAPSDVSWVSTYRFSSVIANTMVDASRRVLIIGEAAHLFPPFGARGMNSAIADAYAAAQAIALDTRSGGHSGAERYNVIRLSAAKLHAEAATKGFRVLHPSVQAKALQRAAAFTSHAIKAAGKWLEEAPYSSTVRAGSRY